MKLRLLTVLLFLALLAVSVGWFADRINRTQSQYLHVYSCRYDFQSNPSELPNGWQCLATISFKPGEKIYFHSPMYYSPTITIEGTISSVGRESVDVRIRTEAFDPALACIWEHSLIEQIGNPFVCDDPSMGMEEFMIMVSHNQEPPDMSDFVNPYQQ